MKQIFKSIGQEMPRGTGVDSSIADGSKTKRHKCGKTRRKNPVVI
jgi:hypothetical protein